LKLKNEDRIEVILFFLFCIWTRSRTRDVWLSVCLFSARLNEHEILNDQVSVPLEVNSKGNEASGSSGFLRESIVHSERDSFSACSTAGGNSAQGAYSLQQRLRFARIIFKYFPDPVRRRTYSGRR
jgi:hypothetical protein